MADQVQVNPLTAIENNLCPGCKQSAVNESGGLVVAFGQSFFHVDCFKCAKCNHQVTADTNLLLLSDGSPICANCSYNCNICQQPILDEAIMTGDDSYHAHCFKCKVCRNRIDELVFAKTSQGIYCMACHNERMAKIRRHAQRKREKEKAASGSASSSTRDRDAREHLGERAPSDRSREGVSTSASVRSKASTNTFRGAHRTNPSTPVTKRNSLPPTDETPTAAKSGGTVTIRRETAQRDQQRGPSPSPSYDARPSQTFSITVAPPEPSSQGVNEHGVFVNSLPCQSNDLDQDEPRTSLGHLSLSEGGGSGKSHLSPSSVGGSKNVQRRKSYDDGVRPLNFLFGKKPSSQEAKNTPDKSQNIGLIVPNSSTSRSERRRSINPGLAVATGIPPEMIRSHTLPIQSADSSAIPSPSKPIFDMSSRRASNNSSLRDSASISTVYHSPSSSPTPIDTGRTTPESVRARTVSYDPHCYGPHSAPPPARPGTPLRSAVLPTSERDPVRSDTLGNVSSSLDGLSNRSVNGRLSPVAPLARQPARLDGVNSSVSSPLIWNDRSGMAAPASPSHVADVPHSIESGTDTEAEGDFERKPDSDLKLDKLEADPDVSTISQFDGSDESSPVERTSVATFIAPALPPIRFSMSGSDFSDFLKSVGGVPPLKSLDEISEVAKDSSKRSLASTAAANSNSLPRNHKPPAQLPHPESSLLPVANTMKEALEAENTVPNMTREFPSRGRAGSESPSPTLAYGHERKRVDSNTSLNIMPSTMRITLTTPESTTPTPVLGESYELVVKRLQDALADANEKGLQQVRFEKAFMEATLLAMEQKRMDCNELRARYDGTKRTSQQYLHGLTVAQKEYDRELVARRNAEAEVIRLRVLLSGQAAKLTALNGETNRQEARRQLSEELSKNLDQLEKDLSKLKVERDLTLAEVEELCTSKSSSGVSPPGDVPSTHISRSLTMRLDNLKSQYQHELIPLTEQREALVREIAELKAAREQFLEETTVLNARNEELAQLSAQYTRRMDAARSETPVLDISPPPQREDTNSVHGKKSTSFDRPRPIPEAPMAVQHSLSASSTQSTNTLLEDREAKANRMAKPDQWDAMSTLKHGKFIKWPGSRTREASSSGKMHMEHNFQQASTLRFTRCDHCGDKLWGSSQFRCSNCHINVHSRCISQVQLICAQQPRHRDDTNGHVVPLPSMFGRELVEQVRSDSRWGERRVPIIVEKCIEAVDTVALDYEGIYRKTGGNGQTKVITQLFERQDYGAFDLRDTDRFNDICSVTSVLKTYFRSLPVPLLTYDLHEEFISSAGIKDPTLKTKHLQELVDRLPPEHYYTLRLLVLHLHRVREHSDQNLMTARNLGVVFGPTLMWSRNPGSEFSDMAGKALMVEWLVENAVSIFPTYP